MFSSLNALLPSGFSLRGGDSSLGSRLGLAKENVDPGNNQPETLDNTVSTKNTEAGADADELGSKKKPKAIINESFIVVRPPPAVSNHPLNLQLQLVPPSAPRKASGGSVLSSGRKSFDSIAGDADGRPIVPPAIPETETSDGAELRRTETTELQRTESTAERRRSTTDISLYSTYSTTSLSSNYSAASSATGPQRRIVPLYNLSAHNVMQNTVLDAGTDAKVAKFTKKGLEIIELAFLEAFEIWGISRTPFDGSQNLESGEAALQTAAAATRGRSVSPSKDNRLSKRVSIASFQSTSVASSQDGGTPQVIDFANSSANFEPGTPKRSKKIFGKLFKKKEDVASPSRLEVPAEEPLTPKSSRGSQEPSVPFTPTSQNSVLPEESTPKPANSLLPPVLDLQATLIKTSLNDRRPSSYVWVMRKWMKRNRMDGLKGMISAAGDKVSNFNIAGLGFNNDNIMQEVEFRFEWIRFPKAKGKAKRGREMLGVAADGVNSQNLRRDTSAATVESTSGAEEGTAASPERGGNRSSPDRETASTASQAGDAADESDPEDSETPWTCTLTIHHRPNSQTQNGLSFHLPHFPSPGNSGIFDKGASSSHLKVASMPASSSPGGHNRTPSAPAFSAEPSPPLPPTKVKLGTIYPAPHHPKVVAQLKVPFPLPDIDVHRGTVHRRKDGKPTVSHKEQGFLLTAEEIKDVICCTAFWVVVREGFGGVGKEKRKGDGWRIRA